MDIKNEITETALKFMESSEIAEHLRSINYLHIHGIVEIIMCSRSPFDEKISAMRFICDKLKQVDGESDEWKNEYIHLRIPECESIIKIGELALNELTTNTPAGTVYILSEHSRINSLYIYNQTAIPFATYEAARNGLLKKAEEHNEEEREYNWYYISKWIPASNGELLKTVEWKLSHDGIMWGALPDYDYSQNYINDDSFSVYCDFTDGSLPTFLLPYDAGDIVTVDCRPALKVHHAVIAEMDINNENGFGGKRIIYLTKSGKLESSWLHRHLERYKMPHGLYRFEKFTGELPGYEAALKKISEDLKRNPSLGEEDNVDNYLKEFSGNIKNFLPDDTFVGDIVKVSSSSCGCNDCNEYNRNFYAIITDINSSKDDVEVIEIYWLENDKYRWHWDELTWRRVNLKSRLENKYGFYIEKCAANMLEEMSGTMFDEVFGLHKQLSDEFKRNPALANDDEFIEKLFIPIRKKDKRSNKCQDSAN